jgi:hypothetical protein
MYYTVYNTGTAATISRHRSREAAERKIQKANRQLQRLEGCRSSYMPWAIANPGQVIGLETRGLGWDTFTAR